MSKALDPLRRLVVQFNARIAHFRAFPAANIPPPAPPHVHAPAPTATAHSVPFSKPASYFGQFQVKVAYPSHKDGPVLLAHLNKQFSTVARNFFVPEPVRVAAVDYACRSAGRPHMASLLSKGSQTMLHHQPLRFAVPRGFAGNVGFFSSRGFSSGAFKPALNGPVRMMAQMYTKPLSTLPANNPKLSEKDRSHHQLNAKKRSNLPRNKAHRGGEIKKRSTVTRISASTVKAFLQRAALVEQQHQILTVCNANAPITTATAISLAKVAGKTIAELQELPKLKSCDDCPTNVDMCFILDASPLWHLDTMVSALHTDSLRAPKELNIGFIDDLLEITNAQYQHFLEVSAILQKLVKCPEVREITLEGYELRVHFVGTTLFDMAKFLQELSIDPKSPHFDLEEVYVDQSMAQEQYFPQASVNGYYAPSLSDTETWDDYGSLASSLIYGDPERCASVASFAALEPQDSPWEGLAAPIDTQEAEAEDESDEQESHHDYDMVQDHEIIATSISADVSVVPTMDATGLFPGEEPVSPWKSIQESTESLDRMSSKILNSKVVSEEYFDDIRGFLDSIEAVHRHSEKLFGSPVTQV
ncbi:hypothetical protein BGX21_000898 [Mortierella sp. AD011]|nr:hypothetical protein BGX20_010906 [Mortierella sp. AD010]KAF9401703.1 hypothetical protein BGX21_000898 [Mortierella sp. AD011]